MRRKRAPSIRGSGPLLIALILSALIGIASAGWQYMADAQTSVISRKVAVKIGNDEDGFAVELANELLKAQVINGYLAPPYNVTGWIATYWVGTPTAGWNWTFTPGFPQQANLPVPKGLPVAFLLLNVCNGHLLSMKNLAAGPYSAAPSLPIGCPLNTVTLKVPDAVSGSFLELYSSVTVPQ